MAVQIQVMEVMINAKIEIMLRMFCMIENPFTILSHGSGLQVNYRRENPKKQERR